MAWLRPNDEAERRIDDVADDDVEGPTHDLAKAVVDYLQTLRVASSAFAKSTAFVDIHSPLTLRALDSDVNVEPLLDSKRGRDVLGEAGSTHRPHLDQAAVLLASGFGRQITQHCSLAIWDLESSAAGVAYRSRHDLIEWCWAAYDTTEVSFPDVVPLSPHCDDHNESVRAVAELWDLPIYRWTTR